MGLLQPFKVHLKRNGLLGTSWKSNTNLAFWMGQALAAEWVWAWLSSDQLCWREPFDSWWTVNLKQSVLVAVKVWSVGWGKWSFYFFQYLWVCIWSSVYSVRSPSTSNALRNWSISLTTITTEMVRDWSIWHAPKGWGSCVSSVLWRLRENLPAVYNCLMGN